MSETATVDPTPADAPAANPGTPTGAPDPAQASTGTVETQTSDAPQTAPGEESFFSGDPKTLPPELQQAYKNMLKDYKAKTQDVAETKKKAQAYDQLTTDQRFRDYWSGLNRQEKADFRADKAKAEEALGKRISDDEFSKAFESKDNFLDLLKRVVDDTRTDDQRRIQELEQKLTVSEAGDVVDAFATEVGEDGKALRPDFYDLNKDGYGLIAGFLRVNPPANQSEAAYREQLGNAYSWAKNITQDYYNKGKSEALAIVQKKAAASSEMPTQAAKGVYSGPDPKKLSVREAIELAKKGQRIPQVYD